MKRARVMVWLLGVVVSTVGAGMAGHPVMAQALPSPTDAVPGLSQLLSDPGAWLTAMFNSAVLSMGQKTTGDVVGFMDWLLGSGNVIRQTPATLSYSNPDVSNLWGSMRLVGNGALAVVTIWGGVNLMVHPHIRAPYHGALEL